MSDTPETMNTNMLRNLYETQEHRVSVGDIWEHCESLERERDAIIDLLQRTHYNLIGRHGWSISVKRTQTVHPWA